VGSLPPLYFEPGETPGPSGPGSSVVLMAPPFLKVVLGSGCFKMLGSWWEKLEGAAVAGLRCFVDSPLLSFLFLFGHVCAVTLAFFLF
jgi:hypothetical protein